jgi:hypothetical protein
VKKRFGTKDSCTSLRKAQFAISNDPALAVLQMLSDNSDNELFSPLNSESRRNRNQFNYSSSTSSSSLRGGEAPMEIDSPPPLWLKSPQSRAENTRIISVFLIIFRRINPDITNTITNTNTNTINNNNKNTTKN